MPAFLPFLISLAASAVSTIYLRHRQRKQQARIEAELDARKGFTIPIDGEPINLPIVYGYQKVGGVRTFHKTSSDLEIMEIPAGAVEFSTDRGVGPTANNSGSTWGYGVQPTTKNAYLHVQQALCFDGIEEFIDFEVNGVNWDAESHDSRFLAFTDGGTADPTSTQNGISANNTFTNVAWISQVFELNRDDYNYNGVPEVVAFVKGTKIKTVDFTNGNYVLSTDKTFNNNPAFVLMDYLIRPRTKGGVGIPEGTINLESFYQAAVISDTVVVEDQEVRGRANGVRPHEEGEDEQDPNTRDIRLYECNITLDTKKTFRDNIELILETMGQAELIWSEGQYKLVLTYPEDQAEQDALITAVYTDADIVTNKIEVQFAGAADRYNRATVKFLNEEEGFKTDSVSFPSYGDAVHQAFLAEDNNIENETEYFLQGGTQRQIALAKAEHVVRNSRLSKVVQLELSRKALIHEVGDLVELTSEFAEIDQEVFTIEEIEITDNLTALVKLVAFDFQTLAWNVSDDFIPETRPLPNNTMPNVTNLTWNSGSRNGDLRNGYLTWDNPDNIDVQRSYVYYRHGADALNTSEWTYAGDTRDEIFDVPPLSNDIAYVEFLVQTEDKAQRLSSGAVISVTGLTTLIPILNTNVTASTGPGSIEFSWADPQQHLALKYQVYMSTVNDRATANLRAETSVPNATLSGLVPADHYFWIDIVGWGGGVAQMSAPVYVTGTSINNGSSYLSANSITFTELAQEVIDTIDASSNGSASAEAAQIAANAAQQYADIANNHSIAANASALAANTFQAAALTSMIAANAFATAAEGSANDAATWANTTYSYMLDANTSSSDALIYRNEAASSASSANTSAASASASEGIAVSAATDANTSATAAANSAIEAQTYANASFESAGIAEGHALSANTSAGTAILYRNQAVSAATDANTSANNAAASAVSAALSEGLAADSVIDASAFASASANSATAAATSANSSAQSAQAAEDFKIDAQTFASNAEFYANTAVIAANSANTSAAAAAASSGVAVSAQNAAADSATDASGFADDAEEFADASFDSSVTAAAEANSAGQSASAALGHSLAANTSASEAGTFRNEAVTAANNANNSASAAAISEGLSANSASNAEGFANNASQSAGDALVYRNAAANSASDASGSASQAATSAGLSANSANEASGYAGDALVYRNQAANSAADADQARAFSVDASDLAVAVETRLSYGANLIDPGFELGEGGAPGLATGWIGDSYQANAFTSGVITYEEGSNFNPNSPNASTTAYGADGTDAGRWWWIGKRFEAYPGQVFDAEVYVWMNSTTARTTMQAAGTYSVGEDDAYMHYLWYDANGDLLSQSATQSANYQLTSSSGTNISAKTFYKFDPSSTTAPSNAAFLEVRLVAADGNGTASGNKTTYAGFSGNASVLFDDFNISSNNGPIREVTPAEFQSNISRAQAGVSESQAAGAAIDANNAASAAEFNRDVSASLLGSEAYSNPVFAKWDGTYPDGWGNAGTAGGSITKSTSGRYGNSMLLEATGTPTENKPYIQLRNTAAETSFMNADDCHGVHITAEIEKKSGTWSNGGCVRVQWSAQGTGGTSGSEYFFFDDFRNAHSANEVLTMDFTAIRPEGYVPGSSEGILKIFLYATSTFESHTRAAAKWEIHRFSVRELSQFSNASIYQQAVADLNGIQSSVVGMRAQAGTAGASLELVALDDPDGAAASSARISADQILLDGSVKVPQLTIDEFLDIDADDAGFRMGKQTAADFDNDGIYMGRTVAQNGSTGFGLFAGRTANGQEDYILCTKDDGLVIKNALFEVGAGVQSAPTLIGYPNNSFTVSLTGKTAITMDIVGGGRGGQGGGYVSGSSGSAGSNGSDTTVVLKDGSTTIQSWTADGGTTTTTGSTTTSMSPYGDGGAGGAGEREQGDVGPNGANGAPGGVISIVDYDITSLTDPKIVVTVGGGGSGGSGYSNGEDGGDGVVRYSTKSDEALKGYVLTAEPTAQGTFTVTSGDTNKFFPQINPKTGIWLLENPIRNMVIEINFAGDTVETPTVSGYDCGPLTFIGDRRPKYSHTGGGSRTIRYKFWAMG